MIQRPWNPQSRLKPCLNCGEQIERTSKYCWNCGGNKGGKTVEYAGLTTEPRPEYFGLSQEQVNDFQSQIDSVDSIRKTKINDAGITTGGIILALIVWAIYLLNGYLISGKLPNHKFIAAICSWFLSYLIVWGGSVAIQKSFINRKTLNIRATVIRLRENPLYHSFSQFKEAQLRYEAWLIRAEENKNTRKEEWDKWQQSWSRGKTEFWLSLDGWEFEDELAGLYRQLGYKATMTPATGDDGIDIILKKKNKTIIVQCKAHAKPVGSKTVRELLGALIHSKADEAILACTSGFTPRAKSFATNHPIKLISLTDILKLQASVQAKAPVQPPTDDFAGMLKEFRDRRLSYSSSVIPAVITHSLHIASIIIPVVVGTAIALALASELKSNTAYMTGNTTQIAAASTPSPTPDKYIQQRATSISSLQSPQTTTPTPTASATIDNVQEAQNSPSDLIIEEVNPPANTTLPSSPTTLTNDQDIKAKRQRTAVNYYTIGSSQNEVLNIQGTPDSFTQNQFRYGSSFVYFRDGYVIGWNNSYPDLRVKLIPTNYSVNATFTIGSSKDEVLSVQGTPDSFTDNQFRYGSSFVYFSNNQVRSWNNSYPDLKAQLIPTYKVEKKSLFTIGSTKDEVLSVQGSPDSFSETQFRYGSSFVYFQDGKVVSWNNSYPTLKVRMTATQR